MGRLKKTSLRIDYEIDFSLIGIVSPLKDYRLCWHINQSLQLDLSRLEDIRLKAGKKQLESFYSRFSWHDELNKTCFQLISNKYLGEQLIPEQRQIDFFLMVQGAFFEQRLNELIGDIRQIEGVQAALGINAELLKSNQNLILE